MYTLTVIRNTNGNIIGAYIGSNVDDLLMTLIEPPLVQSDNMQVNTKALTEFEFRLLWSMPMPFQTVWDLITSV